ELAVLLLEDIVDPLVELLERRPRQGPGVLGRAGHGPERQVDQALEVLALQTAAETADERLVVVAGLGIRFDLQLVPDRIADLGEEFGQGQAVVAGRAFALVVENARKRQGAIKLSQRARLD